MNPEALVKLLAAMEERLRHLESYVQQSEVAEAMDSASKAIRESNTLALLSMVRELAAREGVSPKQFDLHFATRAKWYHDLLLRKVEDINPNWAGQIDERDQSDEPPTEEFPPLFPP